MAIDIAGHRQSIPVVKRSSSTGRLEHESRRWMVLQNLYIHVRSSTKPDILVR